MADVLCGTCTKWAAKRPSKALLDQILPRENSLMQQRPGEEIDLRQRAGAPQLIPDFRIDRDIDLGSISPVSFR